MWEGSCIVWSGHVLKLALVYMSTNHAMTPHLTKPMATHSHTTFQGFISLDLISRYKSWPIGL